MRLRISISSSLRHQRGTNQSDIFPLIYGLILCAEYMSTYMDTHTTPCPKVSAATSHMLSSLPQASACPTPWFSLIQLHEFSLLFLRPLLQEGLLNWEGSGAGLPPSQTALPAAAAPAQAVTLNYPKGAGA